MSDPRENDPSDGIALIGLACRLPGAADAEAFWRNLCDGVGAIRPLSDRELAAAGVPPALLAEPSYVKAAARLDGVELFDAAFFGLSAGEAEITDPQHRLFLECAWEALEDAGYGAEQGRGAVGVYAGCGVNRYLLAHLLPRLRGQTGGPESFADFQAMIGNDKDFLATRVSYRLNLTGPSLNVQTACSTSLVAVHLACQALLNGECDLALAGGVSIRLPQAAGYVYQEGLPLSPDGTCRAFDAAANGTVFGSGAGVVVLKRLADALADGDTVRAVLLGSAVNNDGAHKAGYTTPGIAGQAAVIAEAQAVAGVEPATIGYVEAHGTGTPLGDPVEVAALAEAFGPVPPGSCALGSVKASLGHLDTAAGVASLIKVALALERGLLPPSLGFERPNPEIDFAATPFRVQTALAEWKGDGHPRRAGVSSFGIGGTNAHAVLEEAPQGPAGEAAETGSRLLVLSARDGKALAELAARHADHLERRPDLSLSDVCFTAAAGRQPLRERAAFVAEGRGELIERLRAFAAGGGATAAGRAAEEPPGVVFLFTGQGAQYAGMGRALYETHPVVRRTLDRCGEILRPWLERPLLEVLDPAPGAASLLDRTDHAQPALFALEYALAELWRSWGIEPVAAAGHSVGEYVAACVAGAFGLEEGLRLIAERGRLMQALPGEGTMAAVFAAEAEIAEALRAQGGRVALAAVNGPRDLVVSGERQAVEDLCAELAARGVDTRPLAVSHAFHSALMEPGLDALERAAGAVAASPLRLPLAANGTGRLLQPGETIGAAEWRRHSREPVRFHDGLGALHAAGHRLFLEIGPAAVLSRLGERGGFPGAVWLPSLRRGREDRSVLLESLARLYVEGVGVDWRGVAAGEPGRRRRVPLPTYPFQRQRYWIDPPQPGEKTGAEMAVTVLPAPPVQPSPEGRRARILARLVAEAGRRLPSSGTAGGVDVHASFLSLGADSIALVDTAQAIEREMGVKIPLRAFFEELSTLDAVAAHLDERLPAQWGREEPEPVPIPAVPAVQEGGSGEADLVERILNRQLDLMAGQLEVLRGLKPGLPAAPAAGAVVPRPAPVPDGTPFAGPAAPPAASLTPRQRACLDALVERYTARTAGSRRRTEEDRRSMADIRYSMGARPETAAMAYPVVAARAEGGRIRDLDGNEYVDLAMGFGVHLFGHAPRFVAEALERQMRDGLWLGPQSHLAGRVAEGVCALTGMERAFFANSGTEAVMTAVRLARAATGRERIALFSGSYHGHADVTLAAARHVDGEPRSVPWTAGVPQATADQALVLGYGDPAALDLLERHGDSLAAVLVEPVQSRRPDLQPREFLHELAALARRRGITLIFDETITGFRLAPGGAQEWFGIRADLATYGKSLGGGMPLGVVAGQAAYLDRIDGGRHPAPGTGGSTFAAGTFCKHPLAMAAAAAVLDRLRAEGAGLLTGLNRRTAAFQERLNALFAELSAPVRMTSCGSLFRLSAAGNVSYLYQPLDMELLFFALLSRGVYVWEGRTCFLSTAHTDEDLDRVAAAVRDSVEELQEGGFLGGTAVPRHSHERTVEEAPAVPAEVPLTAAQRQLWLLAQLNPEGSVAYRDPISLLLRGPLDAGALRQALQSIVDRHEALRTRFAAEGEVQAVAPRRDLDLPLLDLSGSPDPPAAARVWLAERSRDAVDLERGPLFAAHLLRLGGDRHVLALSAHHIVIDGWSWGVVLEELGTLYSAACRAEPVRLPPARPFREHAARLARELGPPAVPEMEEHRRYWHERFATPVPPLALPTDRPRPALKTYRGGRYTTRFEPALHAAARRLGEESGCTLLMVLFAAFSALLHRWTDQDEAVIGLPTAGRSGDEERLVGYCTNLLPVLSRLDSAATGAGHLRATRSVLLDAYAHADYPFAQLLGELHMARDLSRLPLVSVLLNLERPPALSRMHALEVELFSQPISYARFDLSLNATETGGALVLDYDFGADLFDPTTLRRLAGHFEALLRGLAARPASRLDELPLLSAPERAQLLREWNDRRSGAADECVHHLFEAQARRTPEAVAVTDGAQGLTYAELDAGAAALAGFLRRLGVGPERRVAVCLERSADLVLALLGVLKAGGAYVPLDPAYPRPRLALMLEDSGVEVLLTQESLAAGLPCPERTALVCVDRDRTSLLTAPGKGAAGEGALPANLAYVIYTSGSTGRPKGVQVTHRSVARFLRSMLERPGLAASDTLLAVTTVSFDIAGLEIFLPLAVGARVWLASREEAADGALLARLLERSGSTVMQATPASWRMLLAAGWRGDPRLKVLCGGEALPPDLARELVARGGSVWNLYGPTETTIWSAVRRVGAVPPGPAAQAEPVGGPIGDTEILILGRVAEPLPAGVPGELLIGGAGLARGYLGRPDLTAERFVPHPVAEEPGARLYRTGDLARRRAGGTVEYLGRLDHQVKVRGVRVEPAEVEAVLAADPRVAQAAVVARRHPLRGTSLAAYVVPASPGSDASPGDPLAETARRELAPALRRTLLGALPEAMVPASITLLDALPLTPNGKVDRNALPAPDAALDDSHVAPRTPVEEILAGLWAEVLGLERVGAADHFFELGGHSLLATQLVSRLRDAFGVEMPLRRLFEAPVLFDFAAAVEAARRAAAGLLLPPLAPVRRAEVEGGLPLSFDQQRLWFLSSLEGRGGAYLMPAAVRLAGPLDRRALARALTGVVRRHEALRTRFPRVDGSPVQEVMPPLAADPPLCDLTALPEGLREAELRSLAYEEGHRPFDLARGPLFRLALLRLGRDLHVLLVTLHHIVADGWSIGVLLRDLAAFYGPLARGEEPALPDLALQYPDFAVWQRRSIEGEALEAGLRYWQERLAGAPPLLELPLDRPRPARQTFRGGVHPFRLGPERARELAALSRRHGASLFMTLLAAFDLLLARYSRQDDLVVGIPIANRGRSELEPLIGFFVNTLVLRLDLAEDPVFLDLLAQARERTLEAYAHQDVPFEKIVERLQPERNLDHNPLFQVMFVLQNAPAGRIELPGLALEVQDFGDTSAKFDLLLSFEEEADGGLAGRFEYASDLFAPATLVRLTAGFERLLGGIVADPARRLGDYPLIGEAESHHLRVEWNDNDAPWPRDLCVHQLFARQVARTPDATAVVWEERSLTFAQLDALSDRLARPLRGLGVEPGVLVALCLRRTLDLIVALMGILKAGGAYVPLDPAYPRERLRITLEDSAAPVLVTETALADLLPEHRATTVWIDSPEVRELLAAPAAAPPDLARPGDLAYVLYTSGSTGRPKGAGIEHRNSVAFLTWVRDYLRPGDLDGMLASTSLCFDSSIFEIFAPLAWGGRVILAENALQLPAIPAAREVTWVNTVPSAIAELVRMNAVPPAVAAVSLAGEPLQAPLVQQIYGVPAIRAVYDFYGLTEDTTYSTAALVRAGEPVTIGRPVSNTRLYILDRRRRPVPLGVPGELYIGGARLARGYLNRPELTAERFIDHRFEDGPPEQREIRLYKTGDLARYRPDGMIEYLGRLDHQVKVRGFRIELGEVEAGLLQHPEIESAVVLVREDAPGDRRLAAYFVPRPGTPERTDRAWDERLRAHLRLSLPEHMIPSAFVLLAELPLTPNGKLDRRALPAPQARRAAAEEEAESGEIPDLPQTPLEHRLAEIWQEILGCGPFGVHDSFFDLGGYSLLLVRLLDRVQARTGIEVPIVDFLEKPTLAAVAARAEGGEGTGDSPSLVSLAAEAVLPEDVRAAAPYRPDPPRRILLTGATGFVGAFLLAELLRETRAEVLCLVRAADAAEARRRIDEALAEYLLLDGLDAAARARIVPLPGDLGRPRLGLGEDRFDRLAAEVDAVVHNGALVSFTSPYDVARGPNVEGTLEILRLAGQGRAKPVHFISTVSVFTAPGEVYAEGDDPGGQRHRVAEGYAASKWVAEKLVADARGRGIPCTIHRLGRVTGHSVTGACKPQDFFHRLLLGCAALGAVPAEIAGHQVDLTPVDFVASAVVRLMSLTNGERPESPVFHLVNPRLVAYRDLFEALGDFGRPVVELPFRDWLAEVERFDRGNPGSPFEPLVPLLRSGTNGDGPPPSARIAATVTSTELARLRVGCPPPDAGLLHVYLGFLRSRGYL